MNVSDRYLLSYFLGFSATGIYSAAYKFPTILTIIYGIFYKAWQISSIEQYNSENKKSFFSNVFRYLYLFMFFASIIFAVFLKPLVYFMTGSDFRQAWLYIPFLILGTAFHSFSSFFGVGYLASKKTVGAFRTTIISSIVNVSINILLIPIIGIQAASISTACAFVVLWYIRLIETRKYFEIAINWKIFYLELLLAIGALFMNYLSSFGLFFQILFLLIFIILEKRRIKFLLSKILLLLKKLV